MKETAEIETSRGNSRSRALLSVMRQSAAEFEGYKLSSQDGISGRYRYSQTITRSLEV